MSSKYLRYSGVAALLGSGPKSLECSCSACVRMSKSEMLLNLLFQIGDPVCFGLTPDESIN